MKRTLTAFVALLTLGLAANAQINYKWQTVRMDSTYDEIKDPAATDIIAKHSPRLAPLQEIIGYSNDEYASKRPDSGLSNFAADIILETAEKVCGSHVELALTNFGGIRTSLPKGAVRVYDIYSIFPFDNSIVVFDIKGADLYKFLEKQARRPEAFSNVRMDIVDKKITFLEIDGKPFDKDKVYKFATIDFLMDGGDGIQLSQVAMNLQRSEMFLRDAIVDYIKQMNAEGKKIDLKADGRVTFTYTTPKPEKKK